jgi:hypothetical protein
VSLFTPSDWNYLKRRLAMPFNGIHPKSMKKGPFAELDARLRLACRDTDAGARTYALRAVYKQMLRLRTEPEAWSADEWTHAFHTTHVSRMGSALQAFLALAYRTTGNILWSLLPAEQRILSRPLARRLHGTIVDDSIKLVRDSLLEVGYSNAGVLTGLSPSLSEMILISAEPDVRRWTGALIKSFADHPRSRRFTSHLHAITVALATLGILDAPTRYRERFGFVSDAKPDVTDGIGSTWLEWLARWESLSAREPASTIQIAGSCAPLCAGSWLSIRTCLRRRIGMQKLRASLSLARGPMEGWRLHCRGSAEHTR